MTELAENPARTERQYREVIASCKDIFLKKNRDYGTSWAILRLPSLTDQIYIKAERTRSLQEKGVNKVGEGMDSEFRGIINYCVMALILLELRGEGKEFPEQLREIERLEAKYDETTESAFRLMERKNHDYGEAWRNMRIMSFTDLILMKLMRLKQIEDNEGQTLISEGEAANYLDILNYSVFALIKLSEDNG